MTDRPGNIWLEAFNGTWAILAVYCVGFLLIHLYRAGATRRLSWWRGWHSDMPLGVQLAVGTMISCVGVVASRGAIWFWRVTTHGDLSRLYDHVFPLAFGGVTGSLGFLCILRVVTVARFGWWPTLAACGTVVAYWLTFLAR